MPRSLQRYFQMKPSQAMPSQSSAVVLSGAPKPARVTKMRVPSRPAAKSESLAPGGGGVEDRSAVDVVVLVATRVVDARQLLDVGASELPSALDDPRKRAVE